MHIDLCSPSSILYLYLMFVCSKITKGINPINADAR